MACAHGQGSDNLLSYNLNQPPAGWYGAPFFKSFNLQKKLQMNYPWRKRQFFVLFIVVVSLVVWYQHDPAEFPTLVTLKGQTMGTTYSIKYLDPEGIDHQSGIDSLLQTFNQSLSTYIPDSEISRFNKDTSWTFDLPYFLPVLRSSRVIYEQSDGAFDPTVGPLVNAWGFGPDDSIKPDSVLIDSLLRLTGFDRVFFDEVMVTKPDSNIFLDFSAVAKGYGVDVIGAFLRNQGIENYFVEIGGEVLCKGKSQKNDKWRIGINKPSTDPEISQEIQAIIELQDQALATSGNYRNFYEKDGVKYAHTISPYNGYPVNHSLLSATVVANDCMTADAWATAFMVMGYEKAKTIIESNKDLEAYFVFSGPDGEYDEYVSTGLKESMKPVKPSRS
jgi:thiamine biosynthesis lipoprotein